MALVINTNMASLNAQRNLSSSQSEYNTSLQRLSSGLRINSAKDDAAGLAISAKFESQITGLDQAVRNAGDGVSLAQTAEGALGTMTDNLQRIRELAVQSSNSTNSEENRVALQAEVEQLMSEITRTAEETNFNGQNLLDGSFNGIFQIGADAGQTVEISISELTASKLGASSQAGVSALGNENALSNGDLVINGEQIRSSTGSDDNLSYANAAASGIAKAAAINEYAEETGVTATVDENVMVGSGMADLATDGTAGADATAVIAINGVDITIQGTDNSDETDRAATRSSVVASINAFAEQTGVTASDGGDEGGIVLTAADGRNIVLEDGTGNAVNDLTVYGLQDGDTAATSAGADADGDGVDDSGVASYAGYTLTAENASTDIVITGGNGTGSGDLSNSGLTEGTYTAQNAYVTSTSQAVAFDTDIATTEALAAEKALDDGDLVIEGVTIRASSATDDTASYTGAASSDASASGIAIAAAINDASDDTGVTATVNATEFTGAYDATTALAGTAGDTSVLTLNGIDITLTDSGDYDTNLTNVADAINQYVGQTGVTATNNGKTITLTAEDGRNISTELVGTSTGVQLGLSGVSEVTGEANTTYSTVTLNAASAIDIEYGSNGIDGVTDSGFAVGSFGGGEDGTFLEDIDISTFEGAQDAIVAIDNALETVTSQQAELGAIQNRFESTVTNLEVTQENLTAAQSAIQDADFAEETAAMSRASVLQQAGISVLSQANSSAEQVLSLLG
ncbi:flagellin [Reinekea thalattae]|uniref:Flagellin n=1 Tax=Reinekea thalattae TaxID=2593301 RepID=A0A5C8Z7M8_9GAMM|nr:flagellin [Reinekea thalattae]TXR53248.1 flagellin [Reinekea thalattae]